MEKNKQTIIPDPDRITIEEAKENLEIIEQWDHDQSGVDVQIAENVGESNIRALEEKFKNDTFSSTVIGPVKQYNGHGEMKITDAGREACAQSVVRFSENENNMRIPYPSEEEMDVAMKLPHNTREWEEQVEGKTKQKTLLSRFKSIFRK